jgi:nuclear pore complex protein Nup62
MNFLPYYTACILLLLLLLVFHLLLLFYLHRIPVYTIMMIKVSCRFCALLHFISAFRSVLVHEYIYLLYEEQVCMFVCVFVCMFVCVFVCMFVCVCDIDVVFDESCSHIYHIYFHVYLKML